MTSSKSSNLSKALSISEILLAISSCVPIASMVMTLPFTSIKSKSLGIAVISLDLLSTFIWTIERPISQRKPERLTIDF